MTIGTGGTKQGIDVALSSVLTATYSFPCMYTEGQEAHTTEASEYDLLHTEIPLCIVVQMTCNCLFSSSLN